jgi:hypothetical protein
LQQLSFRSGGLRDPQKVGIHIGVRSANKGFQAALELFNGITIATGDGVLG